MDPVRPNLPPEAPVLADDRLDALFAELDQQTSGPLDALRSWPTWLRRVVVAGLQLAVVGASLAYQGPRDDLSTLMIGLAAVLVVAMTTSLVGLRSAASSPRRWLVFLPWALLLPLAVAAPPVWPGMQMPFWDMVNVHVMCFLWSTGTAAAAVVPWVLFDRHALARRWSTFGAAGAAGLLGFVVQMAVCPLATPEHKLLSHASSGLAVAAILALLVLVLHRGARRS